MNQKETGGHYLDCVVRAGLPEGVTLKLLRKVRVLPHWGKCCRRRGRGVSRFCRCVAPRRERADGLVGLVGGATGFMPRGALHSLHCTVGNH